MAPLLLLATSPLAFVSAHAASAAGPTPATSKARATTPVRSRAMPKAEPMAKPVAKPVTKPATQAPTKIPLPGASAMPSKLFERYDVEISGVWRGGPSMESVAPPAPSSGKTRAPAGAKASPASRATKGSRGAAAKTRGKATARPMVMPGQAHRRVDAKAKVRAPAFATAKITLGRVSQRGGPVGLARDLPTKKGTSKAAPANRLVHLRGWKAFTKTWDSMSGKGMRLIDVEATRLGGETIYSGLFTPAGGGYALISLSDWEAFTEHWVKSLDQGLELIDIEILREGSTTFYIGVYRERRVGQTMIRTSSWDELASYYADFHDQGLRLIDIERDTAEGTPVFTGVWSTGTGGEVFLGLPDWHTFTTRWEQLAEDGYRLVDLETFEQGGATRYLGVWSQGEEPYALWSGGSPSAFDEVSADLEGQQVHLVDFEVRPANGLRTATVWLPGYREPQTVTYRRVIDGQYLIEGDVLVDPTWTPARKTAGARPEVNDGIGVSQQALSSMETAHLWPMGIIPVEISKDFTAPQCRTIEQHIKALDQQTTLAFYPRTTEEDYISFRTTDDGCHTATGWHGGRHRIFLDPSGCLSQRTVKHETLHAAGFHHEQIRDDRDAFVQVLWGNIQSDKKHNFEKKTGEVFNQTTYDYRSVMHYFPNAFGVDGKPTLRPTTPGAMLGGTDLSNLDVLGVDQAYAAVQPSYAGLFDEGPPVITETTYDRCRTGAFRVGGKSVAKGANPGVIVPLGDNRFSWTCGGTREWTTCPDGTTHVRARRDSKGRIEWNCMVKAPAPGSTFIGTEIDRCGDTPLEIQTTAGRLPIPDGVPTFVEVPDRRITWWCGGTKERATLPPGTRHVRVAWTRGDSRRIEWQSFTAGNVDFCK